MAPEKDVAGKLAPDFSCAIVRFASGVVARITFSIVAPLDHSLMIVGQEGVLEVADVWDFDSPIYIQQRSLPNPDNPSQYLEPRRVYPLLQGPERPFRYYDSHNMDQMRGVAEMARAIRAGHQSRLSADRALHVLEATLAIKDAGGPTAYHKMETPFEEVEPVVLS
jgi:predicted dehydrogenase